IRTGAFYYFFNESLSLLTKQFIQLNGENKGFAKSMVSKLEAAKSSELRGNENARDGQLHAYKTNNCSEG
ncbi:hypothetical protein, partial [Neobacillus sp. 19]|uniref:hypothetical protein n=1 Tax=Neobacillus sp. 19 TaxID=3394458 RepID=UPI003BF73140